MQRSLVVLNLLWTSKSNDRFSLGDIHIEIRRNFKFSQVLPTGLVCLATNQVAGRGKHIYNCKHGMQIY